MSSGFIPLKYPALGYHRPLDWCAGTWRTSEGFIDRITALPRPRADVNFDVILEDLELRGGCGLEDVELALVGR